jgi:hypothetical protein
MPKMESSYIFRNEYIVRASKLLLTVVLDGLCLVYSFDIHSVLGAIPVFATSVENEIIVSEMTTSHLNMGIEPTPAD